MNKDEFIKEVAKLDINLTNVKLEQLEQYKQLLQDENKLYNLTSIIEEKQIYLKHFYDSLTIVKTINLTKIETLLDVGTGAGFPGIVLKIVFPNLHVTLLDSNNKKIKFLNKVIEKLDLKNIKTIHDRCESFAHQNLNKFDVVTSRAVSSLDNLLELCLPMVKINGYFIPLKGDIEKELKENEITLKILNSKIEEVINFKLPKENSNRNILKIRKLDKIEKKYPRTYDKIKKYPLKNNKI